MSKFSLGVWNHGPSQASRTCWVSPSFNYSEGLQQFSKIQDAIDYVYGSSWYSDLSNEENAIIYVYPGKYIEQLNSYPFIQIMGLNYNGLLQQKPVYLYNTGADAAHYPFGDATGHLLGLNGFNIRTDVNGCYGALHYGKFHNCSFKNGHFIQSTRTSYGSLGFKESIFFTSTSTYHFNITGTRPVRRVISLADCHVGTGIIKIDSTLGGLPDDKFSALDTNLNSAKLLIGGDYGVKLRNTHTFGTTGRHEFDTTGEIDIQDSTISNGIHFKKAPSSLSVISTGFKDSEVGGVPAGEADITSVVNITNVNYSGNTQDNGICGNISIKDSPKNVGGDALNRYMTLQDAVHSVQSGERGIVRIHETLTGLPEILPRSASAEVTIEGFGSFGLSFTGDIVEVGAGGKVTFKTVRYVNGAEIHINGAGAELVIQNCPDFTGHIKIDSGLLVSVDRSSLTGSTGCPAITMNNTTTNINIGYSSCKGAATQPAVLFTVDADLMLRAKFDTFMHGSGGGNAPLQRTGTYTVNFSAYNCASNVRLDQPPGFTNVIVSGNNTIDTSINF